VAAERVGRIDETMRKVLMNGLATRFCVGPKVARKILLKAVKQRGKLRRLEGGDIMHTHDIVPKRMNGRDVSLRFFRPCECQISKLNYIFSFSPIIWATR